MRKLSRVVLSVIREFRDEVAPLTLSEHSELWGVSLGGLVSRVG
jgi:hypothetical protein